MKMTEQEIKSAAEAIMAMRPNRKPNMVKADQRFVKRLRIDQKLVELKHVKEAKEWNS